jgi:glycosyltransferase involved in cell wall biosynthesis
MDRISRKFSKQLQEPAAPPQGQQTQPQQLSQLQGRRVLIGTPCYDGRIEVWYANSLIQTIRLGLELGVEIMPIWLSYDALIQRARNDLMGIMMESEFDDIVFIDSDIDWNPTDFFKLLNHPVDVVGGPYRKKGDFEQYVAKILDPQRQPDPTTGLIHTEGLGTGFLRFSKAACQYLWDTSVPYEEKDQGKVRRWIFDVEIRNGELYSEDILVCDALNNGGFEVWLDPSITCGHIGIKRFEGNFTDWYNRFQSGQSPATAGYGLTTPPDIKSLYE